MLNCVAQLKTLLSPFDYLLYPHSLGSCFPKSTLAATPQSEEKPIFFRGGGGVVLKSLSSFTKYQIFPAGSGSPPMLWRIKDPVLLLFQCVMGWRGPGMCLDCPAQIYPRAVGGGLEHAFRTPRC